MFSPVTPRPAPQVTRSVWRKWGVLGDNWGSLVLLVAFVAFSASIWGIIMNRRTLLASLTGGAAVLAADARNVWAQSRGGPGRRNLITDVAGLAIGQAEDM